MRHFVAARGREVLVLQASPVLGAFLGRPNHEPLAVSQIAWLLAGSFALTAHVFVFNDWAGQNDDVNDPRRAAQVFGSCGIGSRQVASLAIALLVAAMLFLALVSAQAVLFGAAIAALSLVYSGSASWGKGRPIAASLLHLIGGMFHFLLGYTVSHAADLKGVLIAFFFGLVFAAGHLNQEVRDYDADLSNGIRTNAVVFGRRRIFLYSQATFTASYAMLALLVSSGILARPLWWAMLLWPWHLASSIYALRKGLGFEVAVWMQRRYRLQFALLGLAMLATAPPAFELTRRTLGSAARSVISQSPERARNESAVALAP